MYFMLFVMFGRIIKDLEVLDLQIKAKISYLKLNKANAIFNIYHRNEYMLSQMNHRAKRDLDDNFPKNIC